jgi:hypothetical protein
MYLLFLPLLTMVRNIVLWESIQDYISLQAFQNYSIIIFQYIQIPGLLPGRGREAFYWALPGRGREAFYWALPGRGREAFYWARFYYFLPIL